MSQQTKEETDRATSHLHLSLAQHALNEAATLSKQHKALLALCTDLVVENAMLRAQQAKQPTPKTRLDINTLTTVIDDPHLIKIGVEAIEDQLLRMRASRISTGRDHGLVIKDPDGAASTIIRLSSTDALRIGVTAIAEHLTAQVQTP